MIELGEKASGMAPTVTTWTVTSFSVMVGVVELFGPVSPFSCATAAATKAAVKKELRIAALLLAWKKGFLFCRSWRQVRKMT